MIWNLRPQVKVGAFGEKYLTLCHISDRDWSQQASARLPRQNRFSEEQLATQNLAAFEFKLWNITEYGFKTPGQFGGLGGPLEEDGYSAYSKAVHFRSTRSPRATDASSLIANQSYYGIQIILLTPPYQRINIVKLIPRPASSSRLIKRQRRRWLPSSLLVQRNVIIQLLRLSSQLR